MIHFLEWKKTNKILLTIGIFLLFAGCISFRVSAEECEQQDKAVTSIMGAVLDKGEGTIVEDASDEDDMSSEEGESIVAGAQIEQKAEGEDGFCVATVVPKDIAECCAAEMQSQSYTYSGGEIKPVVALTYYDEKTRSSKVLTPNKDYIVTFSDNTNAGCGKVIIEGIGDYTGTISKEFVIQQKSLKDCTALISYTEVTGDGTEKKPGVSVMYKGLPLLKDRDYCVVYKDNVNAGVATVTIKGTGNWSGTIDKNFTIKYDAVKDLNFVPFKGSITLNWKQVSGATGYEIFRSTSLNGSYSKVGVVSLNEFTDQTASCSLTYYYKVRAFGKINGADSYGAYSAPCTVDAGAQIRAAILPYEGVKYVYGGTSPKGWDCSGFTQWIMKNKFGVNIPRTAREQAKVGTKVNKNNQSEWMPGDLIFFSKGGRVCHVAVYIGDGQMMHASSTYKKTIIVEVDDYNRRCTANTMTHVRRVL